MHNKDIIFIGGGIATTATMIELLAKILEGKSSGNGKLNIAVVEKTDEVWLGIAYGKRTSPNGLSITNALEFVYEPERPAFFKWVVDNKQRWTSWYRENGGITAARWLERNMFFVDKEDWEAVFIPRFLFGWYMKEKLQPLIEKATSLQLIDLQLVNGEAVDISESADGIFKVSFEGSELIELFSRKVVIATGSLPVRNLSDVVKGDVVYINDFYHPGEEQNLELIRKTLADETNPRNRNILVVGTNASSIELLYLLQNRVELTQVLHKLVLVSPSGQLPHAISAEKIHHQPTPALDELEKAGGYSLEALMDAATADLKLAVRNGANVEYIATVINKTLALLKVLGDEAYAKFIGIYGMKLSGMFRRAGHEYKGASQLLLDLQLAKLQPGRFVEVVESANGGRLHYKDVNTGALHEYDLDFRVVINCTGSETIDWTPSKLIANLLHRNMVSPNLSGKGVVVNEHFEASPNLYAIGPLIGGNVNPLIHFWHLENAPRIMYLAPYLADELLK